MVTPQDLANENLIGFSDVPHVLREVMDDYLRDKGIEVTPSHRIDNFAMGISLVASKRGIALLPAYVEPLLPWSVVSVLSMENHRQSILRSAIAGTTLRQRSPYFFPGSIL